jgi:hypothetical protein
MVIFLSIILIVVQAVFAWNPTPLLIEEQVQQTAFMQLRDFQGAAKPEYNAYVSAGIIYLPLPTQSALSSEWGIHNGFAFKQNIGMWLTNNFDGRGSKGLVFGLGWFGERQGWDNEDFLFVPNRGMFSKINQIHTLGLTVADSSKHLLFGGGLQYLNAKDQTLGWWLLGTWGRFSILPNFHKNDLRFINAQLNLQARELRGNGNSWQNYLPDLECSYFSKDSIKMFVSQNIFKQKIYLESAFWTLPQDFAWAALKLYPDPSRLLFALETTLTKKENSDIYFGGGIVLPFLRVAYNSANDYEAFFKNHGTWIVEIRLAIGTSSDAFFALNAPQRAPSEISEKPVKKSKFGPNKEWKTENGK